MAADGDPPTHLAQEIWGASQAYSHSWGARLVRRVARDLFPDDAPGKGRDWELTPPPLALDSPLRQRSEL